MITAVLPVWNTEPAELREAMQSLRMAQIADEIVLVNDHGKNPRTEDALQEQFASWTMTMLSSPA